MNDDLRPGEKSYSIVHRDRWKSPRDPDAEIKLYETDDLDDVAIPPSNLGITVIAYTEDGEAVELTENEAFQRPENEF